MFHLFPDIMGEQSNQVNQSYKQQQQQKHAIVQLQRLKLLKTLF